MGKAFDLAKGLSFTCANSVRWNLGRRILKIVESPFESAEAMSEAESRRFETSRFTGDLPDPKPVRRIYIYCGPCACAIQTALKLTWMNDASKYFEIVIRIDERLPTSCRRSSRVVDVLVAIRDTINLHELKGWESHPSPMGCVDCPELEKRIYSLEQEASGTLEPKNILQKILFEHSQNSNETLKDDIPVNAIIFLAETDLCHFSLESHPFRREARKPRETDIFAFKGYWSLSGYLWQRQYMGSYSRSTMAMEKKTQSSLPTGLIPPLTSELITSTPHILRNKRPRSQSSARSDD